MSNSILSVRLEPDVKQSFIQLCEELGLTASAAVNTFVRQMLREQALPFVPSIGPARRDAVLSRDRIVSTVARILVDYPEIKRATLFGSYARGEADTTSDVDLRVQCDEGCGIGLLRLASLTSALEEALGKSVDVVSSENLPEEWIKTIEREGVVIYERA